MPYGSSTRSRLGRFFAVLSRLGVLALLLGAAAGVRTQASLEHSLAEGGLGGPALGGASDADDDDGEYKLSSLRILNRAVLHIKEQYVDPKRVVPRDMLLSGLEAIEKQVAEVMVEESAAKDAVLVSVGAEQKSFDIKNVDSLWEMSFKLRDVLRFVEPRLQPDQDKRDVEYATINGMLSTLDPHSVLLPPSVFEEMKMTTQGEFGGLGIVIGLRDGALTIISPMDGTPAAEVGLEAKDQITKIGDESTINMALDEAVKRLRGKPGTQVTIWVLRKGWTEPRRFAITRAIIKIVNVTHKLLPDNVGWVKVKNFQQDTASDVQDAIRTMRTAAGGALAGLILDLRNNPGGLLEQAVDLSDLFLDTGVIVSTVGEGDRVREEKTARWAGTERDLPVVVLVNGGSASASEIVAGALKNNDRALVAGTTTFGKGSVQTLLNFKDNSALKLTIAQYLTPGDISIQSIGITPDVELAPVSVGKESVDLFPDTSGGREKDLDKHLEDARTRTSKPSLVVRHLEDPPGEDDEKDAREVGDKFKSDFEIEFARGTLLRGGAEGRTRKALLEAAEQFAAGAVAEQEGKLVEVLKGLGVDWTAPAPLEGREPARLTARVLGPVTATAGESLELRVEVQNDGPGTVHRLRAATESDNTFYADRELLFGRLAPGEKREWTVKVKLPKDMPARADEVKVVFHEAGDRVPAPLEVRTLVKDLPRPAFRYTVFLDDGKGNGDGQLQPGESADLVLTVTNDGPGVAEEPLVLLKNMGGRELFIKEGRAKLEKLAAGQSVTAHVAFEAQPDVKRQVEMRLTVMDSAMAEYLSEKFVFPVVDSRPPVKPGRQGATVTADTPLLAAAVPSAAPVARLRKGAHVAVDRMVAEYARVDLGEGRFGFLPFSALRLGGAKDAPKGAPPGVTWLVHHRAPDVSVMGPPPGTTTAKGALALSASVADPRGLKDTYVFVNDQKVFYRSLAGAAGQPASTQARLEAQLPLKKGTNYVSLVVRVDNELTARRILVIHRDQEPETAQRPAQDNGLRHR
ncbi:MAG: PDZ domain-containing protein [Deltaproteobacteria bacterium]|nr:PDZ domain-containing protein [Deltaproteobacteria bacterium]